VLPEDRRDVEETLVVDLPAAARRLPSMEADEAAGADLEDALVPRAAEAAGGAIVVTVEDRVFLRGSARTECAGAARISHRIGRQSALFGVPAEETAGEEQLIAR